MDMQSQNEVLASTLAALQATYQLAKPLDQQALVSGAGADLYAEGLDNEGDDAKGPWTPEVMNLLARFGFLSMLEDRLSHIAFAAFLSAP
jgi:hypothetical protein